MTKFYKRGNVHLPRIIRQLFSINNTLIYFSICSGWYLRLRWTINSLFIVSLCSLSLGLRSHHIPVNEKRKSGPIYRIIRLIHHETRDACSVAGNFTIYQTQKNISKGKILRYHKRIQYLNVINGETRNNHVYVISVVAEAATEIRL